MSDRTTLDTLFSYLYGPAIGQPIADLAGIQDADRVIVLSPEARGPSGAPLVEISPASDNNGMRGDDLGVLDPLPTVDIVQWNDEVTMAQRLSGGWDVVVGFPPQGSTNGPDLLTDFLRVLCETASPGARAVLILSAGLLSRAAPSTRTTLLEAGAVSAVVFPSGPPPRSLQIASSTRIALVQWAPGPVPDSSTRFVSLSQTGEIDGEFVARVGPDQRWSYEALDPERSANLAGWAQRTRAVPLPQLVSFPRARSSVELKLMPLSPRQITSGGLDTAIESRPYDLQRDGPLIRLLPGDIVGRTIGDPQWTTIGPEEGHTLGATRQVLVIRPEQIDTAVLLAFLRSDAASLQLEVAELGSTIPRTSPRALRELLVPTVLPRGVAAHSDDVIREFRAVSAGLADDLSARYRSAFDAHTGQAIVQALADAVGEAEMALDLVRRATDPLHRARQFLPHPLARILRSYDNNLRGGTPQDVYGDLLRFGETAITLLGIVGLSFLDAHANDARELAEWHTHLRKGGIPLGIWLASANGGAEHARRRGESLGGVSASLATKSPLNQVLGEFLAERNDQAHGSGPRSPVEFELRAVRLGELLQVALLELSPLARAEWFVVSALRWSETSRRFTALGRSLSGDHPDFEPWQSDRSQPLESGVVIARFGEVDLSLTGFCQLRSCPTCLNEELYYPDRLRGSMLRVRSLDRGHNTEVTIADSGLRQRSENNEEV